MMNSTNYIKSWSWVAATMLLIILVGYGSANSGSEEGTYESTFGQLELQMIEEYMASWR